MDPFLDILFASGHGLFALFNLSGWIWKKTRRIHLVTVTGTMLSWFGLGMVYGWGYCPCTDWHWQIKYRLGQTDLPASYVTYYLNLLTGMDWDPALVDTLVLVFGLAAFGLSCLVNFRTRLFH